MEDLLEEGEGTEMQNFLLSPPHTSSGMVVVVEGRRGEGSGGRERIESSEIWRERSLKRRRGGGGERGKFGTSVALPEEEEDKEML